MSEENWSRNRSSCILCKFEWAGRICNLRRREPTSNQPRNVHLQHKSETKTYGG